MASEQCALVSFDQSLVMGVELCLITHERNRTSIPHWRIGDSLALQPVSFGRGAVSSQIRKS